MEDSKGETSKQRREREREERAIESANRQEKVQKRRSKVVLEASAGAR